MTKTWLNILYMFYRDPIKVYSITKKVNLGLETIMEAKPDV